MKIFFFFYKKNLSTKIIYFHKLNNYIKFKNLFELQNDKVIFNNFFKILRLFIKDGLKLKLINVFLYYWNNFYLNIYLYNNNNFYKYFNEIKVLINKNINFNNPLTLLNWYFIYFNFLISLKIKKNFNLKLKKKKNIKQKTLINFIFIKKSYRIFYFFKWFKKIFYLNYKNKKFKQVLFILLNDIFLNFKNSQIYKYKIYIYKFFLLS